MPIIWDAPDPDDDDCPRESWVEWRGDVYAGLALVALLLELLYLW